MGAWWVQLLIKLALSVGLDWLVKLIPNIPSEVIVIIKEALRAIAEKKEEIKDVKRDAIKRACTGVACPTKINKQV